MLSSEIPLSSVSIERLRITPMQKVTKIIEVTTDTTTNARSDAPKVFQKFIV
jgi:hypothetical protein